MKPFQIPATFQGLRYTADGGLALNFRTQEVSNEEKLLIGQYHNSFGQLLFRPNEEQYTEDEVPKEDVDFEGKKPSMRLRAVLYRLWESKGKPGDSEAFYRAEMERIIEHFKDKLPK